MGGVRVKKFEQPKNFKFSKENLGKIDAVLKKYPSNQKQSAVMPLLDMAQRQQGGWIPEAAMEEIARILDMSRLKVFEVATFYTMYNLAPVGEYLLQFCTTTPCWLCGSGDIVKAAEDHLGAKIGETTKDGKFTLVEVECLGACVNAPMVQINDDYYEDLTPETMVALLKNLKTGKKVTIGSQTGRMGSCAQEGPTSLAEQAKKAKIAMAEDSGKGGKA
ncbi:MAG: NADH-quinone oxidoreductase subunit NuoE [Micavibrio sp.]|nr:MAG: NADH-quinone oxidoreductase subunit NuoE [Micavibrio sp.]